jgi:very-short-patch-repair endonuclease
MLPDQWMLGKKVGAVASGFKIMAHQVQALKEERLFWKYLADHRIKVVMVFRYNIIMQYVSDLITIETRQPACWNEDPIPTKVKVHIGSLEHNIRRIMREKKYLIDKCKYLPHKRIVYEQFKNNCGPAERILEWLIKEKRLVKSRLRKQNPDSLRERVINFDALVAELKRLGFAHLVDS